MNFILVFPGKYIYIYIFYVWDYLTFSGTSETNDIAKPILQKKKRTKIYEGFILQQRYKKTTAAAAVSTVRWPNK